MLTRPGSGETKQFAVEFRQQHRTKTKNLFGHSHTMQEQSEAEEKAHAACMLARECLRMDMPRQCLRHCEAALSYDARAVGPYTLIVEARSRMHQPRKATRAIRDGLAACIAHCLIDHDSVLIRDLARRAGIRGETKATLLLEVYGVLHVRYATCSACGLPFRVPSLLSNAPCR